MPWALRQVFLPRFLHCHHCVNHGQFTGRFFTLMNDNTGHQKYSLLLSKKKWAGLFFTIVQEEVGRFIKENRAPQITVLVVGAVVCDQIYDAIPKHCKW